MKLKKADVKQFLELTYPEYRGRSFYLELHNEIYVELGWQGGSCTYYKLLRETECGLEAFAIDNYIFDSRNFKTFIIDDKTMVVTHKFFCGEDLGVIIYLSPNSRFLAKLLTQGEVK